MARVFAGKYKCLYNLLIKYLTKKDSANLPALLGGSLVFVTSPVKALL